MLIISPLCTKHLLFQAHAGHGYTSPRTHTAASLRAELLSTLSGKGMGPEKSISQSQVTFPEVEPQPPQPSIIAYLWVGTQ